MIKKLLIVGVCLTAMTSLNACAAHSPRTGGGLIGGIAGGLLGNTIGKGSGKIAATVGGAILGTIVGSELANPSQGHSEVIIDNRKGHYRHHRRGRRHRLHEWVEVCKAWPYLRRDRWGDYYTVMRNECRMVEKARW